MCFCVCQNENEYSAKLYLYIEETCTYLEVIVRGLHGVIKFEVDLRKEMYTIYELVCILASSSSLFSISLFFLPWHGPPHRSQGGAQGARHGLPRGCPTKQG